MTFDLEEIRPILAINNSFPQHHDHDTEVPIHVTYKDIIILQDAFQALEMLEKNSARYAEWKGDMKQAKYCTQYARIAEVYSYEIEQLKKFMDNEKLRMGG